MSRKWKKSPKSEEFLKLEAAADRGDTEAKYKVGICYSQGNGVRQDNCFAFSYYHQSAQGGNAWGKYYLGTCYEKGLGVGFDLTEALDLYDDASREGVDLATEALQRLATDQSQYANKEFNELLYNRFSEGGLVACVTAFRSPAEIVQNVADLREQFADWEKLLAEDSALSPQEEQRKAELLHRVLRINRQRSHRLQSQIRPLHWGFNKIEGHWVKADGSEAAEETFVIVPPIKDEKFREEVEEFTNFVISANRAYNQECSLLVVNDRAYRVGTQEKEESPVGNVSLLPELCLAELSRLYGELKGKPFRFGRLMAGREIKEHSSNQMDFISHRIALRGLRERQKDFCQKKIGEGGLIGADW